jgi:hypothetical protein
MENGCYDISKVEFGEDPKHFSYTWPFIVTSQMSDLQKEVFNFHDTAKISPKLTERNIVLCGPMGIGKSYTLWYIAARAYAEKRRLLYISDCSIWMGCKDDRLLPYLIRTFISQNTGLLSQEELDILNDPDVTYDDIEDEIFKKSPTIFILDEHAALVTRYEKVKDVDPLRWLGRFVILNSHPRIYTVVIGASSHANYELQYLRNGSQIFKRFLKQLSREEATQVLMGQGCNTEDVLEGAILDECNCVPRELSQFAKFWKENQDKDGIVSDFRKARSVYFRGLLNSFYGKLVSDVDRKAFLETLGTMFRKGTFDSHRSFTEGFIDLSLCLRIDDGHIQPLVCITLLSSYRLDTCSIRSTFRSVPIVSFGPAPQHYVDAPIRSWDNTGG